jgi:hypothetical protein
MSISYIFIAVFSIILLYIFFEASYFGTKNVVLTQTILSFLFGIGFLTLGIIEFALDVPMMQDEDSNLTEWDKLSQYEKNFFSDNPTTSKEMFMQERFLNSLLVAIFTLLIGLFFITIGGLLVCLY